MKKMTMGAALIAGFGLTVSPQLVAQRVAVDLAWHSGAGVRVAARYASPVAYQRDRNRHCEPSGAYIYCWDTRAHRFRAPVAIHVFNNRAYRPARHHARAHRATQRASRIGRKTYERHARAAHRAWQRWYRQYHRVPRYRYSQYGGRRVASTPAIAVRLAFHI